MDRLIILMDNLIPQHGPMQTPPQSTRELQAKVPPRVTPQGQRVAAPRLAEPRISSEEQAPPKKGGWKKYVALALPLGSAAAAGGALFWLS